MDKTVGTSAEAVADVPCGSSIAFGGFGLCGIPLMLIGALLMQGANELEAISSSCGLDGSGLGVLLSAGRVRRVVGSYVGGNATLGRRYLTGRIELELSPPGTLAERLRAGGAGIPAFYTPAGVGTPVADGGLPWRYGADGQVTVVSPPKETRAFNGRDCVLETAIVADFALVRAARGDRYGNLSYHATARNFNPLCAMSGRVTIAEVEQLVKPGEIDPDLVDTPGVFVQRVVEVGTGAKEVEKLTLRPADSQAGKPGTGEL